MRFQEREPNRGSRVRAARRFAFSQPRGLNAHSAPLVHGSLQSRSLSQPSPHTQGVEKSEHIAPTSASSSSMFRCTRHPPPFPRTNQTNLVPPLVLSGHVVYPTSLRPRQTLPPQISPRALLPLGMRKSTHSSTAPLLLHHSSSIQSSAFATRRGARAQNHASSTQNLPARTRALRRPHLARREREHASGRFGARVRVRVVLTGPQRSGTWYGVRDAACPISTG